MRGRTRRKRYDNLFMARSAFERREARGYAIAESDTVREVGENTYFVPSKSRNREYQVRKDNSLWQCDCPDYLLNDTYCKHIHAVIIWKALKNLDRKVVSRIVKCKSCGSRDIIKDGRYRTKQDRTQDGTQWYKCMVCGKQFKLLGEEYKWIWEKTKIMAVILDLRFKGFGKKEIAMHLKRFYGFNRSFSTIKYLIKGCGPLLNTYAQAIGEKAPDWVTEKMMIKVYNKWYWKWNTMDVEEKLLLASLVREGRSPEEAKRIFLEVVTPGKGKY